MSVYCIVDVATGRMLGKFDLNTIKYFTPRLSTPEKCIHPTRKAAQTVLKTLHKFIDKRGEYVSMPNKNRFDIIETDLKPCAEKDAHFYRIKDTKTGKYILGRDLLRKGYSANIGKLYGTRNGVERAFTSYTGTSINKRRTKTQKVLLGTKKACEYEIEAVKLEAI